MRNRPLTRLLAAGLALTLLGAACSDDDGDDESTDTSTTAADESTTEGDSGATEPAGEATLTEEQATEAATTYADIVFAAYDANVTAATELHDAIDAFVEAPSDEGLQAAKDAWLAARDVYGPTEVFRFYDGPIDNPDDGPEGQINAWPMDEAYVDYVGGRPRGRPDQRRRDPPRDHRATTITAVNEEGGETNISTGWHAIEFLLWGQDLSEDGPGARPVTDYTDDAQRRAPGPVPLGLTHLLSTISRG